MCRRPCGPDVGRARDLGDAPVDQRRGPRAGRSGVRARRGTAPPPSPRPAAPGRPEASQRSTARPAGRAVGHGRAPCGPCRSTRTTRRSCVDVVDVEADELAHPDARWRRAARASPRRGARPGCRRRPGRRPPGSAPRPRRRAAPAAGSCASSASPSAAPGSVGSRPVRCSQAVKTRAAVARRAIVVRLRPVRLQPGQPAAQRAQVEVGDVVDAEPAAVVEQARDVTEVGADRVGGQVALGDEVALVVAEQSDEGLGQARRGSACLAPSPRSSSTLRA